MVSMVVWTLPSGINGEILMKVPHFIRSPKIASSTFITCRPTTLTPVSYYAIGAERMCSGNQTASGPEIACRHANGWQYRSKLAKSEAVPVSRRCGKANKSPASLRRHLGVLATRCPIHKSARIMRELPKASKRRTRGSHGLMSSGSESSRFINLCRLAVSRDSLWATSRHGERGVSEPSPPSRRRDRAQNSVLDRPDPRRMARLENKALWGAACPQREHPIRFAAVRKATQMTAGQPGCAARAVWAP